MQCVPPGTAQRRSVTGTSRPILRMPPPTPVGAPMPTTPPANRFGVHRVVEMPLIFTRYRQLDGWALFGNEHRVHRYLLLRRGWLPLMGERPCLWVGYNPSTAGGDSDDPTVRRMVGFTRALGFSEMWLGNLSSTCATNPMDMPLPATGEYTNAKYLAAAVDYINANGGTCIACWGPPKGTKEVQLYMAERMEDLCTNWPTANWQCLGRTKGGYPRHPLYLPNSAQLEPL